VWITSLPTEFGKILGTAAQGGWTPQWIAQSPVWVNALAGSQLAPYMKDHVLLMSEGPEWGDESNAGMSEMLADIKQFKPDQKPDIYFAFGYLQLEAVSQILEKAVELGDLSHAGILKATEQVGTLKFNGLAGDYPFGKPADRKPSRVSTMFKITPETLATNGALTSVKTNFTTDAAKAYKFPNQS
jgi:hypothetical protein